MAGIYFHIPFCKQACYYCDFHFSTNLSGRNELVRALVRELEIQRDYLHDPVTTIYFGGGTPSLIDPSDFQMLLGRVKTLFEVNPYAEITLEANPDDLTREKLTALRSAGINRLSIGIQSFDDKVLKFLNRAHDATSAIHCVPTARNAGFENISIDLIYAIPGQGLEEWKDNVRQATELNPEHISAYSLTIEEKTVFGNWVAKGKLIPSGEEVSADQFDILLDLLEAAGYEQYEISNFAKPGFYSKHNSSYWKQEKYLGIGPSAHSYNVASRQANVSNNHQYITSISSGLVPAKVEILSRADQINDYLLTTLRTSWGTDLEKLKNDLQYDLLAVQNDYVAFLLKNRLAVIEKQHLKLTREGKFLADKISSDLFLVVSP